MNGRLITPELTLTPAQQIMIKLLHAILSLILYVVVGFYGLTCIFKIGEEIDVVTTTTTTSTLAFTLFPPTTITEATTTTTVTTTTEPKVANAIFWGAKNIIKACIAVVTGFVILSVFAHGFWMIGTDSKSKARGTLVQFLEIFRNRTLD